MLLLPLNCSSAKTSHFVNFTIFASVTSNMFLTKKIPQWSCLCEICENAILLTNGINKNLFPECRLPETIHELVAKFSCSDTEDCMTGKCEVCFSTKLACDNFNTSLSDSTSVDSSDANEESHSQGMILAMSMRKVTAKG